MLQCPQVFFHSLLYTKMHVYVCINKYTCKRTQVKRLSIGNVKFHIPFEARIHGINKTHFDKRLAHHKRRHVYVCINKYTCICTQVMRLCIGNVELEYTA